MLSCQFELLAFNVLLGQVLSCIVCFLISSRLQNNASFTRDQFHWNYLEISMFRSSLYKVPIGTVLTELLSAPKRDPLKEKFHLEPLMRGANGSPINVRKDSK